MNSTQSAAIFFFLACIIFTFFLGDLLSINLEKMGIGGYSSVSSDPSLSKSPHNIF